MDKVVGSPHRRSAAQKQIRNSRQPKIAIKTARVSKNSALSIRPAIGRSDVRRAPAQLSAPAYLASLTDSRSRNLP